jgi:hypothetical protein
MRERDRVAIAPPSQKQLELMQQYIKSCLHIETAAVLSGIPTKLVNKWIELGRKGRPDFVPFVDMIDRANAELSQKVMAPVTAAAFEEGNLQALQWIYKVRLAQREQHLQKKWLDIEDQADAPSEPELSEEDVEAAEARALAALDDSEGKEVH